MSVGEQGSGFCRCVSCDRFTLFKNEAKMDGFQLNKCVGKVTIMAGLFLVGSGLYAYTLAIGSAVGIDSDVLSVSEESRMFGGGLTTVRWCINSWGVTLCREPRSGSCSTLNLVSCNCYAGVPEEVCCELPGVGPSWCTVGVSTPTACPKGVVVTCTTNPYAPAGSPPGHWSMGGTSIACGCGNYNACP